VKGGLGYLQDKTMQGYNASKDVIVQGAEGLKNGG